VVAGVADFAEPVDRSILKRRGEPGAGRTEHENEGEHTTSAHGASSLCSDGPDCD
jgi:hypothetical protein